MTAVVGTYIKSTALIPVLYSISTGQKCNESVKRVVLHVNEGLALSKGLGGNLIRFDFRQGKTSLQNGDTAILHRD